MRAPMIEPDELRGLDAGGDDAAGSLVEVEHLLVEERREHGENPMSDTARNGQRVPDAAQALDLPDDAPRLGEARRRLLGLRRVL